MDNIKELAEVIEGKNPTCPKCNEPLSLQMVAKASAESRVAFAITPAKGEKMDIASVVGSVGAMGKLLTSIGKDMGMKVTVLIDSIETSPEGKLQFNLLIARSPRPPSTGNTRA